MSWRKRSVREERISFVARALGEGCNFSRLCREFGVSRPTGYKWVNRYRESGGFCDLRDRSRRPKEIPRRTSPEVESRVVLFWKRTGWGARKRGDLLRSEGCAVSERTVHRILVRHGLVSSGIGDRPSPKRFERERPNELWQMDFKGEYPLDDGGYCDPLSLLDDHSRFVVGLHGLPNQQGESVFGGLIRTFETYGVPEAMLMDHGTPRWTNTNGYGLTWVAVKLIRQGIRLYLSGVRHPFVCEALAGERVWIEQVDRHLLVRYRHMYVREIDTQKKTTKPLVVPETEL